MVSQSITNVETGTSASKGKEGSVEVTKQPKRNTPNLAQTESTCLSLIREGPAKYQLSSRARDVLLASWGRGTSKQYQMYLGKWQKYCAERKLDVFQPNISDAIEFLVSLYQSGLGYSALNTARSALSSILVLGNGKKFGEHPLVTHFMKGIFELRPALPKYSEIWDVNVALNYLKTIDLSTSLTMKRLTLKLTMLLCLTTGQ